MSTQPATPSKRGIARLVRWTLWFNAVAVSLVIGALFTETLGGQLLVASLIFGGGWVVTRWWRRRNATATQRPNA